MRPLSTRFLPATSLRGAALLVSGLLASACLPIPQGVAQTAPEAADRSVASVNAGDAPISAQMPFALNPTVTLADPWAIGPLPGGGLLVSGKAGQMWRVEDGRATEISGVPEVQFSGQNGFLDVAPAPDFADSGHVWYSYVDPGNALVLERARLEGDRLVEAQQIWRQTPGGRGQPGGMIAFGPDGHLYFAVGDRMEPRTAQNTRNPRGKILRMTLEGTPAPGNPWIDQDGTEALTWTLGHRNPYGLVFAPDGTLWEHEMGPRGGDELNRIEAGQNYGWPSVSNGSQYSGIPIADHDTAPEFAAPHIYWTPVIAPAGLAWIGAGSGIEGLEGTMLIGGLAGQGLVQVAGDGSAQIARWDLGMRVRDVAQDAQGTIWIIEDAPEGALIRLDPA